jgi:hypothetical protein
MTLNSLLSRRMSRLVIMCTALVALSGLPAHADSGGYYQHAPGYWGRYGNGSYQPAYSCWGPQRYAPPEGWVPTITQAESAAVAARNANSQPDQSGYYAQPYDGAIPTPCLYMNPNDTNQVFNTTTGQMVSGAGVEVPGSIPTTSR